MAPDPDTSVELPWTVFVDDNFHYMDEESRTLHDRYATFDEAVAACVRITDESIAEHGAQYSTFGEDPFVDPRPATEELQALLERHPEWPREAFERGFFSAWTYASLKNNPDRAQ